MNGRYARLLSLPEDKGRELIREADTQHVCWVGAERWATQTIVESTFINTQANKASEVQR
jgi:hypothetical protein